MHQKDWVRVEFKDVNLEECCNKKGIFHVSWYQYYVNVQEKPNQPKLFFLI
jgi:hypothetical protein